MMNLMKAMEMVNNTKTMANELDWVSFLSAMCMLFDEYALAHKGQGDDYTAPHMAQIVAEQVKAINEQLGAY